MAGAVVVSVKDVVAEFGSSAVRRRVRVLAARGEHERATAVRAELRQWRRARVRYWLRLQSWRTLRRSVMSRCRAIRSTGSRLCSAVSS